MLLPLLSFSFFGSLPNSSLPLQSWPNLLLVLAVPIVLTGLHASSLDCKSLEVEDLLECQVQPVENCRRKADTGWMNVCPEWGTCDGTRAAHTCNLDTRETETGRLSQLCGHRGLYTKFCVILNYRVKFSLKTKRTQPNKKKHEWVRHRGLWVQVAIRTLLPSTGMFHTHCSHMCVCWHLWACLSVYSYRFVGICILEITLTLNVHIVP